LIHGTKQLLTKKTVVRMKLPQTRWRVLQRCNG